MAEQISKKTEQIELPERDELVVGTVTKIMPYGAFVKLEEYKNAEGMINISEISTKWIRNIKEFVREGERIVAKVLRVDYERKHIDLSLKSVKAAQKKERLELFKMEQRARKLVERVAEKVGENERVDEIMAALYEISDSVFRLLQKTLTDKENALEKAKINEQWKKELVKVAEESIELPKVMIKANLELSCNASNGVEVIRDSILNALKKNSEKDVDIQIKYLGAPKYRIELTAPNYKIAEKRLEAISNEIIAVVTKAQGSGKLVR